MPDSCVCLSDGCFGLVQNIVVCKDRLVKIVVKLFEHVSDMYAFPMRSSDLGTCVLKSLSSDLRSYIADVIFKCVLLPLNDEQFAAFPLLHLL